MVVRVRVRLRSRSGREKELTVLVNSGAESDVPLIAVRPEQAEELGIWPTEDFDIVEVGLASGRAYGYVLREPVSIRLIDGCEVLSETETVVVVDPELEEPIITDITIDELGIQVLSFKKGLWKHVKDPPNRVRGPAKLEQ